MSKSFMFSSVNAACDVFAAMTNSAASNAEVETDLKCNGCLLTFYMLMFRGGRSSCVVNVVNKIMVHL